MFVYINIYTYIGVDRFRQKPIYNIEIWVSIGVTTAYLTFRPLPRTILSHIDIDIEIDRYMFIPHLAPPS